MKKINVLAALMLAFSMNAQADVLEYTDESQGDIEINVFAEVEQSFRITVENGDIAATTPGGQSGLLDLNANTLVGFDGLKSIAANGCVLATETAPIVYADTTRTKCAVVLGGGGGAGANASNSKMVFDVDLAIKVEMSGPGSIDLDASFGATQTVEFEGKSLLFAGSGSANADGLGDQDTETLHFKGEAPFSGGPIYDDTIIIAVTKN